MHSILEKKSRGGWTLGVLLGLALALGACGKDLDDAPGLKPGAHGEAEVTGPEGVRFELAVRAGQLYRFVCTATTLSGCQVQRLDATSLEPVGEALSSRETKQADFFWTADADGLVVMEVRSVTDGETGGFLYIFTEASDDAGDSPDTAVSQPVTETEYTFEGFLETPGDVDAWRISIPTNHVLRAYCSGTRDNPFMEVIRPDGTSLGTFTASYSITDVLELGAKNAVGGDLILLIRPSSSTAPVTTRYLCRVRDIGPDDHPDAPPEATAVTVPARLSVDFMSVKDVDVLAVDLVGGRDYLLKSDGGSSPYYCATTVMDAQGQVLKTDLPSDKTGVTYTAPTTGRYFLALKRVRGSGIWKWWIPEGFLFAITDVTPE
ncbi:hypothetical protein D7Y13_04380 [Corallococcus praedator]|uniref:Peptidase C-terminal archaeal/bacterial domain-containing protein n=1 Tax=Corallococcus praedator TaxID=2316724 RepID=A0ABX9QPC1_9BACT|nr:MULTISPECIES: hypothetical protein [Corallococcus]RKH21533.1 hypothetical protein D7X74_01180 [Corallococcus sp. CA047B]RKH35777.1 hypothetical protein D7X75_03220 [Corallococcus sp. CA031C]RKI15423.1 hypothetical protein D7Y13_04380 [Corallococcus praedator]